MEYKQKYLKYKLKYLLLKQQEQYVFTGGMEGVKEIFGRVDPDYKLEKELEEYRQANDFLQNASISPPSTPLQGNTEEQRESPGAPKGEILQNASISPPSTPFQGNTEEQRESPGAPKGEILQNASISPPSTPFQGDIEEQREAPGAPKGKRPQEILDIIYNRLSGEIDIIKKRIGKMDEDTFKKLFDAIFQLKDTDDDQIMILNLVLFIKDLEHDYNNYLKESKPEEDDRIIILIEKCIRKLDEKIQLEHYSFKTEMFDDDKLKQGYIIQEGEINDTYGSLLLRGNLKENFAFKIPDQEYDPENILLDQGYNPTKIKAQQIELDGLGDIKKEDLLGSGLNKKNIYKFITEKWLKYIFTSLCRLEVFYLIGKDLYIITDIISLIMKQIHFIVTIDKIEIGTEIKTKWKLEIIYIDTDTGTHIDSFNVDISGKGISKNAFDFMKDVNIQDFCQKIIGYELDKHSANIALEKKELQNIMKILWTRLRDIFKLVFGSLKTLGDKSYEFLLVIFIMKYMFNNPNVNFLIQTKDSHFINSLFANVIPLMKLLIEEEELYTFNLGMSFPANKDLLPKELLDNKPIIFTHNQTFSSAKLSPVESPLEEVPELKSPESPEEYKTPFSSPQKV